MRRAVALALLLVVAACSHGGGSAAAVSIERIPRSYVIRYELDNRGTRSIETLSVRRPFDGRVAIGGAVTRSMFARLVLGGGGTTAGVQAVPPGPAIDDVRIDIALADAMKRELVERLDAATVAGRPCQWYRTTAPPEAAHLEPLHAGHDGIRFCVDRVGLVLDERTVVDGKEVRRRTARTVRVDPRLPDAAFAVRGDPVPLSSGGGVVQRLTDRSRTPGDFWDLGSTPTGFRHRGRYGVVEPHPGFRPGQEGQRVAGVVDVYVRGADLLVIDRSGSVSGRQPLQPVPSAMPVDAGRLGRGELVLGFVLNEVRVQLPGGHYVRVSGTLRPNVLLSIARDLRSVPGGTLTTIP